MRGLEFSLRQKFIIIILLGIILAAGCIFLYSLVLPHRMQVNEGSPYEPETICVYVCGEVENSGLFNLPYGSRIKDAVDKAKVKPSADLTEINLALILYDEDMVFVPKYEENKKKSYKTKGKGEYKARKSRKIKKYNLKRTRQPEVKNSKLPEDSSNQLLEEEGIIEVKKR